MTTHPMTPADAAWYHMDGPANLAIVMGLLLTKQALDFERFRQRVVEVGFPMAIVGTTVDVVMHPEQVLNKATRVLGGAGMDALKRAPDAVATRVLFDIFGCGPKALEDFANALFGSKASLVVTNVMGPRELLARMRRPGDHGPVPARVPDDAAHGESARRQGTGQEDAGQEGDCAEHAGLVECCICYNFNSCLRLFHEGCRP
jgi:hypothetical protein